MLPLLRAKFHCQRSSDDDYEDDDDDYPCVASCDDDTPGSFTSNIE